MKKLKVFKFKQFLENITGGSGAPFFGNVGPMYGREKFPSNGVSLTTITCGGRIWMLEDYLDLYNNFINTPEYSTYIEKGGKPLQDFNFNNIVTILSLIG